MIPTNSLEDAITSTAIQLIVTAVFILGALIGVVINDIWRKHQ